MSKEELKARALGNKNFKIKVLDVEFQPGVPDKIGIRQVSLFVRQKLHQMAQQANSAKAQAEADAQVVIESACDPDSGERLFEDANRDVIITSQVGGGWADHVMREAVMFMRRPVVDVLCTQPRIVNGNPALDAAGKPELCGGSIISGEPFCPRCGVRAPELIEQARGN